MKTQLEYTNPGRAVAETSALLRPLNLNELEFLWRDAAAQGCGSRGFLSSLIEGLAAWLPVGEITLTIEPGIVRQHGGAGDGLPESWSASGAARPGEAFAGRTGDIFELRFAGRRLGTLQIVWRLGAGADAATAALIVELVRRLRWVALRYLFQAASFGPMSRSTLWIGAGHAIQRLTEHFEVAVRSHFPVYIAGEFGTDPSSVAGMLHVFRCGSDAPFVEILGAHPEGTPAEWFARAKGGTLYLNGIQDMPPALLCELPAYLPSRLGQWARSPASADTCHFVSSGLLRAEQLMDRPGFPRALMAELSLVELHVPPLRERADDLRALFNHVCQCVGHDIDLQCDEAVWQALEHHAWPENQFELTRLVAQLALYVQNRRVRLDDLASCAPALAPLPAEASEAGIDGDAPSRQSAVPEASLGAVAHDVPAASVPEARPGALDEAAYAPRSDTLDTDHDEASSAPLTASSWACHVLESEPGAGFDLDVALPRALVRALRHLAAHYCDPLTQPDLAAAACTSASHLTALFRQHLGVNFKTLLQHMRVQRARHLLCESPRMRVSDVAIVLGFADLSHFERCFKRISGCSPREYRMQFAP
ncbi:helix-turn-helix domain-containing protein [Burkholderia sp. 22PA0106]|uniref:helix-turn-helix domain-containing protein n=1 Tax=Burkholderia sp. 22PA0106 TaxID=3237371 RepID=UPI0039C30225